jgi:nicotinate-nucleotide pyrophosphorylase
MRFPVVVADGACPFLPVRHFLCRARKRTPMSLKADLQSAIAQAELQADSLAVNVNIEQLRSLSQAINQNADILYDLLGPECFKTVSALAHMVRLNLLKQNCEQMLQEAEDNG